MSQPVARADFAASAPPAGGSRTALSAKSSSWQGGGRRRHQHRVPPLPATQRIGSSSAGPAAAAPAARPSLITQRQRAALHVSAFGFTTRAGQGTAGTATSAGAQSSSRAAAARALGTVCRDDDPIVVTEPEKSSLSFKLCIEALAGGCVQAYTHLFYLSHRGPVCVDALSQEYFTLPEERLAWVQAQLSAIEVLRRQSEFSEVAQRCQELADYFEQERDLDEASWHYAAGLKFATESLDHDREFAARESFANFLQKHNRHVEATEMYESMRGLALAVGNEERLLQACAALTALYRTLGDAHMRSGETAKARRCYEKSITYAKRSERAGEEGDAYDALGRMHEQSGQLHEALRWQQTFRQIAQQHALRDSECQAGINVAGLEDRLGRSEEATASLNGALALARELGDAEKVCRATMQLGEMYRANKDTAGAMTCFREAFGPALQSGNQDLVDSVRIAMGFAAGAYYMSHAGEGKGYLAVVCTDVKAQLAWMGNGVL